MESKTIYAHSKLELAKAYMKTCQKEDEVWFVGDSLHDYEVASQAGGKMPAGDDRTPIKRSFTAGRCACAGFIKRVFRGHLCRKLRSG